MNRKQSAFAVAAKARRRLESDPPNYPPAIDFDRWVKQIVVRDGLSGETHVLTCFISKQRIDQYRVTVDGKPWKDRIGFSRLLAGLRKASPRFSNRL